MTFSRSYDAEYLMSDKLKLLDLASLMHPLETAQTDCFWSKEQFDTEKLFLKPLIKCRNNLHLDNR